MSKLISIKIFAIFQLDNLSTDNDTSNCFFPQWSNSSLIQNLKFDLYYSPFLKANAIWDNNNKYSILMNDNNTNEW